MYRDNRNTDTFHNTWALILGASSGFGFATVRYLAARGMNIVAVYREMASAAAALAKEFKAIEETSKIHILPFNINALDKDSLHACVDNISKVIEKGTVKLLMHSIARGNIKPLVSDTNEGYTEEQELTADDLQQTSYAMSNSFLDWVRALFKAGLFHPDARAIGLTSEGAHKYWKGYAAVSIAKASLESLATYMAIEFAKYGLKTNLIQAGITDTPSLRRIPESEALVKVALARNPMKRLTQPDDVAKVVYVLCMDETAWINGSVIHVDGGEHCC